MRGTARAWGQSGRLCKLVTAGETGLAALPAGCANGTMRYGEARCSETLCRATRGWTAKQLHYYCTTICQVVSECLRGQSHVASAGRR
jgi:hypothetical protein